MSAVADPRISVTAAAKELAQRDPVMARLVAEAGPIRLRKPTESHFAALVRAIVYQQLAGPAASAIHGRLVAVMGGKVEPDVLIGLPLETLRGAGLSLNKTASLRDLASKVLDGTVHLESRRLAASPTARSSPDSPRCGGSASGRHTCSFCFSYVGSTCGRRATSG